MLKQLQEEIRDRTARIERSRREGEELSPLQERFLSRLGQQQGKITELTAQLSEKLTPQAPPEEEPSDSEEDDGEEEQ